MSQVRADALDKETVDILTNLNFIASIKPQHYVNMETLSLSPKSTYSPVINGLPRWWYQRDRFTDLEDINKVIEDAIAKLRSSKGITTYSLILSSLIKAEEGLANYKTTYINDEGVKSRVDAIVSNIDSVISTSEFYDP